MCAADDLLNFAAVCDERSLMIYIEVIEQVQAIVSVRGASGLAELITNLRMLGGQGEARRLLSLLDARFINHSSDRERGKGHSSDDQHRAVSSASVPRIGRLTSRTFQERHRRPLAGFRFGAAPTRPVPQQSHLTGFPRSSQPRQDQAAGRTVFFGAGAAPNRVQPRLATAIDHWDCDGAADLSQDKAGAGTAKLFASP
jgi:hypothetical protein